MLEKKTHSEELCEISTKSTALDCVSHSLLLLHVGSETIYSHVNYAKNNKKAVCPRIQLSLQDVQANHEDLLYLQQMPGQ